MRQGLLPGSKHFIQASRPAMLDASLLGRRLPWRVIPTPHAVLQVSELGQGTFGTVILALDMRHNPPQEIAIKLLPRGKFVRPTV